MKSLNILLLLIEDMQHRMGTSTLPSQSVFPREWRGLRSRAKMLCIFFKLSGPCLVNVWVTAMEIQKQN